MFPVIFDPSHSCIPGKQQGIVILYYYALAFFEAIKCI